MKTSVSYRTKPGVTYWMLNGVPYELVTDTKIDGQSVTSTIRYVPAPLIKSKPTNTQGRK